MRPCEAKITGEEWGREVTCICAMETSYKSNGRHAEGTPGTSTTSRCSGVATAGAVMQNAGGSVEEIGQTCTH